MFSIVKKKGFSIIFKNNYRVSVVWGIRNYGSNLLEYCPESSDEFEKLEIEAGKKWTKLVEVAVFDPKNNLISPPQYKRTHVGQYMDCDDVFKILSWAKKQKDQKKEE